MDLVRKTELAKSTISYRVKCAIEGGFLLNEAPNNRGKKQLVLGLGLPNTCPLPAVEELEARVCAESPQNDSNLRTHGPRTQTPLFNYEEEIEKIQGFEGSNEPSGLKHAQDETGDDTDDLWESLGVTDL
jgi:hypothetical protein